MRPTNRLDCATIARSTLRSTLAKPILAAVGAGFIAIMLAGPGMMIPGHFRLWAPLVCNTLGDRRGGADLHPEVHTSQRYYYRGRNTQFQFHCVAADGSGVDVSLRAIMMAFCGYFLVLFVAISLKLRNVDLSAKPVTRRRR